MSTTPLDASPAATHGEDEPARLPQRLLVALIALYLVWGSTYLAMRIAVETLPPLAMGGIRYVVAGIVLLGVVRLRGAAWPTAKDWLRSVPLGALLFLVGNGLVVVAEKTVPSSVAAVVCATTPLFLSGMGALRGERPSAREALGMVLGISGVAVLSGGAALGGAGPMGFVVLLAPVGWALGSMIARLSGATGFASAAAQMIAGGIWMLVASAVVGESMPLSVSLRSLAAWGYLVVFGSLVGFSAYIYLLRHARPAVATSYAYVNPIIAVVLGAALGGETIGWTTALATALIAAGVMAALRAPRRIRG